MNDEFTHFEAAPAPPSADAVTVEKDQPNRPRQGQVFVAVHAHLADVPYFAGGLCAKLINEGATGYLVRTSNDEKHGGQSTARNILNTEQEQLKMAQALGFKDVVDLYYQNHELNGISSLDLRGRLIFLLRLFKANIVLSFNPWSQDEATPDHWVTGRAVEEAAWMSGLDTVFEEHKEAGLTPCQVLERYCFCFRPSQPYNRVVDISAHVEKKIDALVECRSEGDGDAGSKLRARLAREGKRLPLLGADDRTADREYIRQFRLDNFREHGKPHGLEFAERFHYIDQRQPAISRVEDYVKKHAVSL